MRIFYLSSLLDKVKMAYEAATLAYNKCISQVEGNLAFYLLLKLCGFSFNYSNLTRKSISQTRFPLPNPSLTAPHKHADSRIHKVAPENRRATFETGAPQARPQSHRKSIYGSQTSNKNTP